MPLICAVPSVDRDEVSKFMAGNRPLDVTVDMDIIVVPDRIEQTAV